MVTLQDGATAKADDSNLLCGCEKAMPTFSEQWLDKVVADSADHYRMPGASCVWIDPDGHCHSQPPGSTTSPGPGGMQPISKLEVRGVLG